MDGYAKKYGDDSTAGRRLKKIGDVEEIGCGSKPCSITGKLNMKIAVLMAVMLLPKRGDGRI